MRLRWLLGSDTFGWRAAASLTHLWMVASREAFCADALETKEAAPSPIRAAMAKKRAVRMVVSLYETSATRGIACAGIAGVSVVRTSAVNYWTVVQYEAAEMMRVRRLAQTFGRVPVASSIAASNVEFRQGLVRNATAPAASQS